MRAGGRVVKLNRFHVWVTVLAAVVLAGAVAGIVVFTRGLVVTNLNDLVPWGLWITIDLTVIAMSAGAFLLCAAVYLLGLKRYPPVARTATFGRTAWMRRRWPAVAGRLQSLHHYAPYLAVVGLGLSMLHQSSLGATYGARKERPVWERTGPQVVFLVAD